MSSTPLPTLLLALTLVGLVLVGCASGGADRNVGSSKPTVSTPPRTTSSAPATTPTTGLTASPTAATERPDPAPTATRAPRPGPQQQARLDSRLLAAAWRNDVSAARRLIANGADVNAKDDTVQSAYLVATSEGYLDLLRLTLRHGADVTSLDSYHGTGLIRASERGHADVVALLLRHGIAVDHVNNLGWTALLEAVILGDGSARYHEVVRLLLDAGAEPTLPDAQGTTPAEHARAQGQAVVARLIDRAAAGSGE